MTTITALPPAPSRNSPSDFSTKADAWVAAIGTWTTEVNTVAQEISNNKDTVVAVGNAAATAANTATLQAGIATTASTTAGNAASQATSAAETVMAIANIDFGAFSLVDGELISTYTDTATSTPSISDGDFIITY